MEIANKKVSSMDIVNKKQTHVQNLPEDDDPYLTEGCLRIVPDMPRLSAAKHRVSEIQSGTNH